MAGLLLHLAGFPEAVRSGRLTAQMRQLDADKALYVVRYHGHLMTAQERLAHRHLTGTANLTHGRTDAAAQREVENSSHPVARDLLSRDLEVLRLASEGIDAFMLRTAQRIIDEHGNQIVFNHCPRCGALAKTPKARQCRFCRHDWH